MKIACVYHSTDLDGKMSAAIVKHWFLKQNVNGLSNYFCFDLDKTNNPYDNNSAETLDFIGYTYGQPIPDLSKYDKVIMVDISFDNMSMFYLANESGSKFMWIDHHISAIKDNIDIELVDGIRDTKYAACELTWKYFFPNEPMPEIVRFLGRYDCFGHKGTEEEQKILEFQYGARQLITNYEEAYNQLLNALISPEVTEFNIHDRGIVIYEYLCAEAKQSYKNGFEIELSIIAFEQSISYPNELELNPIGKKDVSKYYKFICINKENFNPMNFNLDYKKDGYDGIAIFFYSSQIKAWHFTLYSDKEEVDCSKIAERYEFNGRKGGGHKGAAGFNIKNINSFLN